MCTDELCSGGTINLTFPEASASLCLYYVGHMHNISAWGFADRKVAALVLLSIKISACQGIDPGRKYWPETVLG